MLGQKNRFHGYGSLKAVYQRGQTARGSQITLKYAQRDAARPYRVAVVVSRKVSKSAVTRNRIRRRVYEAVRKSTQAIPGGTDLVFTVFSDDMATIEAKKLQATIDKLLQKAASQ